MSNWVKQVQAISNHLQNWDLILGEHIWIMSLDFALKLSKQTFPREAFLHFNYEIKRHIQRRENSISRQPSSKQKKKKKKLICLTQMFSNNWVFHSFNFGGIKSVYWWKYHNFSWFLNLMSRWYFSKMCREKNYSRQKKLSTITWSCSLTDWKGLLVVFRF